MRIETINITEQDIVEIKVQGETILLTTVPANAPISEVMAYLEDLLDEDLMADFMDWTVNVYRTNQ